MGDFGSAVRCVEHGRQLGVHWRSQGNLVALNASTGKALWHAGLGQGPSNGPITYELDGTQYLVVGAGDTL